MNKNDNLENFYSGDANWNAFVEMAKNDFQKVVEKDVLFLQKVENRLDFAVVIYAKLGSNGLNWVDKKVPALGGLTPLECLHSKKLILRLKECLLRM